MGAKFQMRAKDGPTAVKAPVPSLLLQRKSGRGPHAHNGCCRELGESEPSLQPTNRKREDQLCNTGHVPSIVHEVLSSPGEPLDAAALAFMEPRLGHDFSHVRVHTDAKAVESARMLNASAYTVSNKIVFGQEQYAPHKSEGRRTLAHELTHVIQQQSAGGSFSQLTIGPADAGEEPEARSAESSVNERRPHVHPSFMNGAQVLRCKQESTSGSMPSNKATASPASAESSSCLHPVQGEEIESLLESRAVTIIEYGAEWCGPCQYLKADLTDICRRFRLKPQPVTVRFYTLDVDDPRNDEAQRRDAPGSVPYLSIYVGTSRRYHESGRPEPEILEGLINEQIEYASHSGAARGALTGLKWGLGIGGGAGLAVGIGLALAGVLTGGLGLLAVAGLAVGGALAGLGLGAGAGALIGALTDKRERAAGARVGFNEAETLIRRRYGRYLPTTSAPLYNALIKPVTQAELQMWNRCRNPQNTDEMSNLVGWTDTGPAPPETIASAEDEPVCDNGKKLEHASLERPVIYYARDRRDLTILIHEGLHAYAYPNFTAQVRNYINEGACEYFTRQLAREIGAPSTSGYDENTERVKALVAVVGEEALKLAYFKGDFSAADRVLGPCGMERWAQLLQMFSNLAAEEVLRSRNRNYCDQVETFPAGLPQEEH